MPKDIAKHNGNTDDEPSTAQTTDELSTDQADDEVPATQSTDEPSTTQTDDEPPAAHNALNQRRSAHKASYQNRSSAGKALSSLPLIDETPWRDAHPAHHNSASLSISLRIGLVIGIIVLIGLVTTLLAIVIPGVLNYSPSLNTDTSLSASQDAEASAATTWNITLDVSAHSGATVKPAVASFKLGKPATYLPYALLDGMRFLGWYTEPNGGGTLIENNTLGLLQQDTDTTLYAHFGAKPTELEYDAWGLPILMYHYFYDPAAGEVGEDTNWMDITLLEGQLAWLQESNYYYPNWEEVSQYIRGNIMLPKHSIVLCSDDGADSFYDLAVPLLMKYNAKMTTFVVAIDFNPARLKMYDPEHVLIQSHSYDMHRGGAGGDARLLTATKEEIIEDVELSASILGTRTAYCYPFGKYSDLARATLEECGVGVALAIYNERAYPLEDPMAVSRLRMSDGISLEEYIHRVSPD